MKKSRVRVFLLHRRLLAVLCTLAVAAGIFYVTLYPASQAAAASTRQLPIYSVERKEKLCSISFDAAWGDGKVRQSRGQTDKRGHLWRPLFILLCGVGLRRVKVVKEIQAAVALLGFRGRKRRYGHMSRLRGADDSRYAFP